MEFTSQFPQGTALAYASIPAIADLPEPLRSEVRQAWSDSCRVIWQVFIGISGIGLLSSSFMKALPLHTQIDERWGIEQEKLSDGSAELVEVGGLPKEKLCSETVLPQLE